MDMHICPFCLHAESTTVTGRPFFIDEPDVEINYCWNCDKEFVVLELSKLEELLKARK